MVTAWKPKSAITAPIVQNHCADTRMVNLQIRKQLNSAPMRLWICTKNAGQCNTTAFLIDRRGGTISWWWNFEPPAHSPATSYHVLLNLIVKKHIHIDYSKSSEKHACLVRSQCPFFTANNDEWEKTFGCLGHHFRPYACPEHNFENCKFKRQYMSWPYACFVDQFERCEFKIMDMSTTSSAVHAKYCKCCNVRMHCAQFRELYINDCTISDCDRRCFLILLLVVVF